uniref:Cysteine desulfurylase n=1 Tax=Solanum tuberosum TaxID=4113 RepID=M1CSQ2_SOLTU
MEFEQLILRENIREHHNNNTKKYNHSSSISSIASSVASHEDLRSRIESFHVREKAISKTESAEKKLSWLRSQIIGENVDFETPFGKRRLTYADHTASGRSLQYIENYIINNVLPFYGNSHTSDSHVGYQTTKIVHESAAYVKKCLGGGEEDAIIFCGSGSTAAIKRLQEVMGISVSSILREKVLTKCFRNETKERWVVFVGPYEHHSNILSWRQSLAEVVEIGLDDNGLVDMETLRDQLEFYKSTNRPLLGSFSACSNVTGTYSDTRAIARLLHKNGAFACFDFAASAPYAKIEMRSGEIDGYDAVLLVLISFLEDTLYVENIEEREDAGTPPIIQKVRTALAFWVKEFISHKVIERMEHTYIELALQRLLPNPNIWILGNVTAKRQAVLSFLIYTTTYSSSSDGNGGDNELYLWRETGNKKDKPLHGPFVAKLLNDLFGIQARGGCACAGPYGHTLLKVDEPHSLAFKDAIEMGYTGVKPGWTRISFPYYMSKEEFEFILAALEFISIYGQRFLPLYNFNWKSGAWTFKKKALKEALMGGRDHNCNFCGSPMMKELNLGGGNTCHDNTKEGSCTNSNKQGIIYKYVKYLETAKSIASLLPKFPHPRPIPEELDTNLVSFRV